MTNRTPLARRQLLAGSLSLVAGGPALLAGCAAPPMGSPYQGLARYLRRGRSGASGNSWDAVARELIRFATLAANSHNSQPWKFRIRPRAIEIVPDAARRCPAVDPDDHHLFASLGCAAENLLLAAEPHGFCGELTFKDDWPGVVRIELERAPPLESPLFQAIVRRQSTRAEYSGAAVPVADLARLEQAATGSHVEPRLLTAAGDIENILELVLAGNSAQMRDSAFVDELKRWIRFSEASALRHRDGLFAAASGNPSVPEFLGRALFGVAFTEKSQSDRYARQVRSSSGVIALTGSEATPRNWFEVGRCAQRFALQATALGLKQAFINQPVEVPDVRARLARDLGCGARRPDLLIRFGYGPELPMSLRRNVAEVISSC